MLKSEISIVAEVPVALNRFCEQIGVADVTAWRWRRLGWLKTTNIAGRQYVMPEDIQDFKRRASAGEFAKVHKTPKRKDSEFESTHAE